MWRRAGIDWDDLKRLEHRLAEALSRLEVVESRQNAMSVEWEDVLDQVRRSYNRLEAAERRSDMRENPPAAPADPDAPRKRTDPFSEKLRSIREAKDAVPPGTDESTG